MTNFLKYISMGFASIGEGFYTIANAFNPSRYDAIRTYDDVKKRYEDIKKRYGDIKKEPYKPEIKIDSSGASTWVNIAEYFLSDEGREELKKMSEFAKRHIEKKND